MKLLHWISDSIVKVYKNEHRPETFKGSVQHVNLHSVGVTFDTSDIFH